MYSLSSSSLMPLTVSSCCLLVLFIDFVFDMFILRFQAYVAFWSRSVPISESVVVLYIPLASLFFQNVDVHDVS